MVPAVCVCAECVVMSVWVELGCLRPDTVIEAGHVDVL